MQIRSYADLERLAGDEALSDAEKLLIENSRLGIATVLGDGKCPPEQSTERTIRADLLRYLILGGCDASRVDEKGVRLKGAWISGVLDLSFATAKGEIELQFCVFETEANMRYSRVELVDLSDCAMPGLQAEGIEVRGDVFLNTVIASATIYLGGAEIGGQLQLIEADVRIGETEIVKARSPDRLNALFVEGAVIKGPVFLRGLKSQGSVSFIGTEIGGLLSFREARLSGVGKAFRGQRMVVKRRFVWQDVKSVSGEIDLSGAHLGDLTDEEASWNLVHSLNLVGLTYDKVLGPHDLAFRKKWLKKGARFRGAFHPQPYQQMAKYYRETGHRHEAVEILIAKEIEQRRAVRAAILEPIGKKKPGVDQFGKKKPGVETEGEKKPGVEPEGKETPGVEQAGNMKSGLESEGKKKARTEPLIRKKPGVIQWSAVALNCMWDWTSRLITGYGYRPWLSLGPMLTLIAIMTALAHVTWAEGDFVPNSDDILVSEDWKNFADGTPSRPRSIRPANDWSIQPRNDPAGLGGPGRDYETFYAFAYAIDVVVPVLNLGQTSSWSPSPAQGHWGYWVFYLQKFFVILGWGVTAIVAAALSGMIRRDD